MQLGSGKNSDSESERLEFWNQFNEVLVERGKPFNIRKATKDQWYNIAIGVSRAQVALELVNKDNYIRVGLYINDDKELFDRLYAQKEEIEEQIGFSLDWQRKDTTKASRISMQIPGLNFADHSNYNELMNEMIDKAIIIVNVFKKYV